MNADSRSPVLGANSINDDDERGRGKLLAPLTLPKNRSTSNLALSADPDRSRFRMSFDGSSSAAAAADHDLMTRSVILLLFSFPSTHLSWLVSFAFPYLSCRVCFSIKHNSSPPARRSDVPQTQALG